MVTCHDVLLSELNQDIQTQIGTNTYLLIKRLELELISVKRLSNPGKGRGCIPSIGMPNLKGSGNPSF